MTDATALDGLRPAVARSFLAAAYRDGESLDPALASGPALASRRVGLPGFEFTAWLALFAPAKTPAPVVQRLAELTNTIVDFAALLGKDAEDLLARLRESNDWARRFTLLENFLLQRFADGSEGRREIAWALRQLEMSDGAVQIGDLATEIGWSRKKLIHSFQRETGLAPKGIGRIYRLNRMLSLLRGSTKVSLAELAHQSGYYDQAHFNRDFRDFAGLCPRDYLAEIAPDALQNVAY